MKLIRLRTVLEMTALSRSSLYRLMDADEFPKSIPLAGRCVAWVDEEVEDWIAERIAMRDGEVKESRVV